MRGLRDARAGADLDGVSLLVVDDDVAFLDYVCGLLEAFGADQVETACDGVEALEALASHDGGGPDLVLTDLRMPLPDGIQLVASIRTAGFCAPILIVTAFPSIEVEAAAARFRDVEVQSKPFEPRELIAAAAKLIGRR